MVVATASEATANALAYTRCDVGKCLAYTRTWLRIDSRDSSAIVAWNNADHQHAGDRTPPRGAPVFWSGGSHGYGHIALALLPSNDIARIRSTDTPHAGSVSTQELTWIERYWGLHYLGWTEDLNGVHIPYLGATAPTGPEWASGDVYVSRLTDGVTDSDSVRRLQYRLRHVRPGGTTDVPINGDYGPRTVAAVAHWQKEVGAAGAKDGKTVTAPQAHRLFGDAYKVIT